MFVLCTVESQSEPSTQRQVGKLLDMMSRRSAKAFDALIKALVMTYQEHAAELLDRNKATNLIQRRDAERQQNMPMQASSSSFTGPSVVVPSGSSVVSTSSSVPSSHIDAVPSSSGQGQFMASGVYFSQHSAKCRLNAGL